MGCGIYEEHNNQCSIFYVEQGESKEHLDRHIQSNLYCRIITAMELAREAPKIYFHEVSKTMGIELIEALRSQGGNEGVAVRAEGNKFLNNY